MFKFILEAQDKKTGARAGKIITPHGEIDTPVFMPVGTLATVKTLTPPDLLELGAQIILGNTYHLYLRPGLEIIRKAGGLHRFMNWSGPLLTDSGGFQVFSLTKNRKIKEEGVIFKSYVDGSEHLFTPASVIEAQKVIGADIMMAFDECSPFPCEKEEAADAVSRTHRWLSQCLEAHSQNPTDQALFGIIQGGTHEDLRAESTEFICSKPLDGIAIGGLSVGEPLSEMARIVDFVCPKLPPEKPHYLMGVGTPLDIVNNVALGIDMFDCVIPTRNARNGQVFTSTGKFYYKAGSVKEAVDRPLDENCDCKVCQNYSVAYLRHLYLCGEMTAHSLATYHNLYFYANMMKKMRGAILAGTFLAWKEKFLAPYYEKTKISEPAKDKQYADS